MQKNVFENVNIDIFKTKCQIVKKHECKYSLVPLLCLYFDFRRRWPFLKIAQKNKIHVSDFSETNFFQRFTIFVFRN